MNEEKKRKERNERMKERKERKKERKERKKKCMLRVLISMASLHGWSVASRDELGGMKAELDKLCVVKTSGFIPAKYHPGTEPLHFLGCLIERLPSGQIIMHQKSYIDHCLNANDVELAEGLTTLPSVDEKSPPEEEVDEDGHTTEYNTQKALCRQLRGLPLELVQIGERFLTLYVDASFFSRGGRCKTGITMYLVNPRDGSESNF